ncbi:uncharacterized protein LOC111638499 [Centruroides sculpturatus]|uniref:uncharacterized protein LOC111638499 n=1 Tax=Centruroides sculpturatus TaxID=218467 RepID=UPI000C6CC4A6|nr:uncharacterized protein LOC111638499 [Centruroides sculpturatus]
MNEIEKDVCLLVWNEEVGQHEIFGNVKLKFWSSGKINFQISGQGNSVSGSVCKMWADSETKNIHWTTDDAEYVLLHHKKPEVGKMESLSMTIEKPAEENKFGVLQFHLSNKSGNTWENNNVIYNMKKRNEKMSKFSEKQKEIVEYKQLCEANQNSEEFENEICSKPKSKWTLPYYKSDKVNTVDENQVKCEGSLLECKKKSFRLYYKLNDNSNFIKRKKIIFRKKFLTLVLEKLRRVHTSTEFKIKGKQLDNICENKENNEIEKKAIARLNSSHQRLINNLRNKRIILNCVLLLTSFLSLPFIFMIFHCCDPEFDGERDNEII